MAKKNNTLDRTTPRRTIVRVRETILARLKELNKTRHWLAMEMKVRPATVYDFLNGRESAKVKTVEQMLSILGLEIRPRGK